MKKNCYLLFLIALSSLIFSACTSSDMCGMPNPWIDCGDNLECAAKKAGFKFPLVLSNYQVRAMADMIEITYPLDENRDVIVRKSSTETDNLDISGDYNNYPVNEEIELNNGVRIHVRGDGSKYYVAYFAAESGVFSINCAKGMTLKEIQGVFDVISDAEAAKFIEE